MGEHFLGNFLSGMETDLSGLLDRFSKLLGNFLSGMETWEGAGIHRRLDGLGNFLSGMETAQPSRFRTWASSPWKLP